MSEQFKPGSIEALLLRPYEPPKLFIFEEVEIRGGYHTLQTHSGPERGWSETYSKRGSAIYRNRVVKIDYPPTSRGVS